MGVKVPWKEITEVILSIYIFIKAIIPILQFITYLTIIIYLPIINNKIKNKE